jgi:hypothetical protein
MKIIYKFLATGLLCSCLNTTVIAQSSSTDGTLSGINQMGESEIKIIQDHWGEFGEMGDQLGKLGENFGKAIETAQAAQDLYNALKALDNNECVPDLTTDASAMMPSGCDEEGACNACYEKAVTSLNHVRKNLARMSCLRINTKTYVESAIAFGDNVSGIHGAMGLAWQNERKGIKAGYEKFKKTYDTKYIEMMESLETALKEINQCEAQFGMRDWYQKAGFIYFEMMKERYKRTD